MDTQLDDTDCIDKPTYWFFTLQQALDDGDLEAAADAVRELRRLGIVIKVMRQPRKAVPT